MTGSQTTGLEGQCYELGSPPHGSVRRIHTYGVDRPKAVKHLTEKDMNQKACGRVTFRLSATTKPPAVCELLLRRTSCPAIEAQHTNREAQHTNLEQRELSMALWAARLQWRGSPCQGWVPPCLVPPCWRCTAAHTRLGLVLRPISNKNKRFLETWPRLRTSPTTTLTQPDCRPHCRRLQPGPQHYIDLDHWHAMGMGGSSILKASTLPKPKLCLSIAPT